MKRPRVSDRSSTTGLTETELIALLGAADADGPRSAALITLLGPPRREMWSWSGPKPRSHGCRRR